MESQPQNPEFRNNPENFHPCIYKLHIFPLSTFPNIQRKDGGWTEQNIISSQ